MGQVEIVRAAPRRAISPSQRLRVDIIAAKVPTTT
jgi:hypothetical protein